MLVHHGQLLVEADLLEADHHVARPGAEVERLGVHVVALGGDVQAVRARREVARLDRCRAEELAVEEDVRAGHVRVDAQPGRFGLEARQQSRRVPGHHVHLALPRLRSRPSSRAPGGCPVRARACAARSPSVRRRSPRRRRARSRRPAVCRWSRPATGAGVGVVRVAAGATRRGRCGGARLDRGPSQQPPRACRDDHDQQHRRDALAESAPRASAPVLPGCSSRRSLPERRGTRIIVGRRALPRSSGGTLTAPGSR